MLDDIIKNNSSLVDEYPIFDIKYNKDGSLKEFYDLASEKDIKETQIKSDENELEYKYNQNEIGKSEYEKGIRLLQDKLINQNLVYDNLIFDSINKDDIEVLKEKIKNANLESIELRRLSTSISSIIEKKLDDFQKNNRDFKTENISAWNYKYDVIAKNYSKVRELESYILELI